MIRADDCVLRAWKTVRGGSSLKLLPVSSDTLVAAPASVTLTHILRPVPVAKVGVALAGRAADRPARNWVMGSFPTLCASCHCSQRLKAEY